MEKLKKVIADLVLDFVIVFIVGLIFDKLWGIEQPVWQFALAVTIGWAIYYAIGFVVKKLFRREEKEEHSASEK